MMLNWTLSHFGALGAVAQGFVDFLESMLGDNSLLGGIFEETIIIKSETITIMAVALGIQILLSLLLLYQLIKVSFAQIAPRLLP